MALLLNHLEQISSSARTIGELPFPPAKIFTNALLGNHEITTLIRDTEPHERALFSIDPKAKTLHSQRRSYRRTTVFPSDENKALSSFSGLPKKQSAVARVLGSHMLQEIEGYRGNATSLRPSATGGVNVEVLLKGAEKLCAVYSVAEAPQKIATLRNRYRQLAESVASYEAKVANQTAQINRMNKNHNNGHGNNGEGKETITFADPRHEKITPITDDELRVEEQAIRDLEQKKHALEERVASMEMDLGGLLR